MRQDLNLLEKSGRIYVALHPTTSLVVRANGEVTGIMDWTAGIPGLQVTDYETNGFRVEKLQDDVEVPQLTLAGILPGRPPRRIYYEPGYSDFLAKPQS